MYLIVGSECSVEAVTMTTITCITGPQNLTGPEYPGECSIKYCSIKFSWNHHWMFAGIVVRIKNLE